MRTPKRRAALIFAIGMVLGGGLTYIMKRERPMKEPLATPPVQAAGDTWSVEPLKAAMDKLRPLHEKLGKPRPGDWLDQHEEDGQTFAEYVDCEPNTPQGVRRVIYIQPLGDFTDIQRKIVTMTADYMGAYFNVPVKVREDLPLSIIPAEARRTHPDWGDKQILSTYVLDRVLAPRLPDDAAAYLAFTTSDLWPGQGWNFVFGQASLRGRVGVWSIYRNGDPAEGDEGFRLCLLRTIKTATHETGHMFTMNHCTLYDCNMCGSNHREESDRRPLWLCPECMAKVCWATRADPIARYKKLSALCRKFGFTKEADFFDKSVKALEK